MAGFTSEELTIGSSYSRKELAALFGITDATINTGVFKPAGYNSVWLFITEEKSSDRTQYEDHFAGDDLYFEGQTKGRTDPLIAEHHDRGLELLLFHRRRKDEHPDYAFRYEGTFDFVNSEPGPPTKFHLRRNVIGAAPADLQLVGTADEIRENVRRFTRGLPSSLKRAKNLVGQTTYWVFDEDEAHFAPSKFVGFRNMSFGQYESALQGRSTGAKFDGAVSRTAIENVLGSYVEAQDLTERLSQWCVDQFGRLVLDGVETSKWRFVRLPTKRKYWALVSRADRFAGAEAVAALDELWWTVDRPNPRPGDRVLIWQAKTGAGRRGVIALGEVIEGPIVRESPPEQNRFWRSEIIGATTRVNVRVFRLAGLPIWEDEATWLSGLAVARARGGTVFTVQPGQWHRVFEIAADSTSSIDDPMVVSTRGQGYRLNAAARKAVELHAQGIAEEYFLAMGFTVTDVSRKKPYDLHCEKGSEVVHVEVKGTTGAGESVFLTRNEVEHAKAHGDRVALVIVRHVELEVDGATPTASGGEMQLIRPWDISQGTLSPTQYEYRI